MGRPKGVKSYRSGFSTDGHRLADIELVDSFGSRRCVCACSWVSGWWCTARLATDEWRRHAGVEDDE